MLVQGISEKFKICIIRGGGGPSLLRPMAIEALTKNLLAMGLKDGPKWA